MKYAKKMIALMLVLVPVLVAAQLSSDQRIVANVPFEFMVGNKWVPAGECTIQRLDMNSRALAIRNVGAKIGLLTSTLPGNSKKPADTYALVFHKYGNQHFLAGVKVAGSTATYELPKSKAETEIAQNAAPTEEILLASLR